MNDNTNVNDFLIHISWYSMEYEKWNGKWKERMEENTKKKKKLFLAKKIHLYDDDDDDNDNFPNRKQTNKQ